MAIFNYKCKVCGDINEYNTSNHVPKSMQLPPNMKCSCGGELEKLFVGSKAFDIVGYCYANVYGKKAYKKNLSQSEYSDMLLGNRAPY